MHARNSQSAPSEVNFLVVNYDQTAFTLQGTRRDMLSYPLINFANGIQIDLGASENDDEDVGMAQTEPAVSKRIFDAFYGFTNRSVALLPILNFNLHKKLDKLDTSYTHECLKDNFHTYKITNALAGATNLHCRGVSTPEDMWLTALGAGYTSKIQPWEEKGMYSKDKPTVHIPLEEIRTEFPDNQQYRLTQIAQHAAKAYPAANIKLTFVNDNIKYCEEALSVPDSDKYNRRWPNNVILDAFHHHATSNTAPVTYLGSATKLRNTDLPVLPLPVHTKALHTSGLFAASSQHAMVTRAQKRNLELSQAEAVEPPARIKRTG